MPDYKEMYLVLFRSITDAISVLQKAQQTAEELYISAKPSDKHINIVPIEKASRSKT